jgi:hypothetical protein
MAMLALKNPELARYDMMENSKDGDPQLGQSQKCLSTAQTCETEGCFCPTI